MKLGFIGLGNMGQAIARNLLRAGHHVLVYNRTRKRAEDLEPDGAIVASTPAEASQAEAVLSMVADDHALEDIVFGSGAMLTAMPKGAIHVSVSTISVALSKQLAEAHEGAGSGYIAAPVFGRPEAAAAAKLIVAAAGRAEWIERVRPALEAIGRKLAIVGPEPWQANVLKLAGNFAIMSVLETLGEAFALLRKSGIDPKQYLDIVNGGLFQSPVYETYGGIIAERRFEPAGFKMTLGLKDVRLLLEAAESASVPMPVASVVRNQFLSGIASGHGDADWAALRCNCQERRPFITFITQFAHRPAGV
jgi:3-hydroxyisobutyrate dehydrogenase-like beta-hydroxyacid dehydrogenase